MDLPGKEKQNGFLRCTGDGWRWEQEGLGKGGEWKERGLGVTLELECIPWVRQKPSAIESTRVTLADTPSHGGY